MDGLVVLEYSDTIFSVLVGPNCVLDHSYILDEKHVLRLYASTPVQLQQFIDAVLVYEHRSFGKIHFGYGKLIDFLLLDIHLELADVDVFGVVHVVDISVDQQEQFVFELVGRARVYRWIEKTQFSYVEVWDFETMANAPFLMFFCQDYDCMGFGDEGHELAANGGIEKHGCDFVVEVEGVVDLVEFKVDSCEVDCGLLDKNPFVLLNGEAIDQAELS